MFSRNLRIALLEDNVAWGDKAANLEQLRRNLRNIPEGTDIVVLPELFSTGFIVDNHEQAAELAEWNSGETMREIRRLATEYRVAIVGSFLANTAAQLYNRAFFVEPNGDDTFYDKRHLFAPGSEDKVFNRGTKPSPIIRYRGFNIKVVICYDLRFPVFCRNTSGAGAYDLLIVVANWPQSRHTVWRQLLTARAIENACYVCGVNRSGADNTGLEYGEGSSAIIDFKGRVIAQRMTSPIIPADLSPGLLAQFREKFPVLRDADTFTLE